MKEMKMLTVISTTSFRQREFALSETGGNVNGPLKSKVIIYQYDMNPILVP